MSLHIDFAPQRPSRKTNHLGVGMVTLAVLCGLIWTLTGETEAGLSSRQENMPSEENIQAINRGVDDLNFPWIAILSLLENSIGDDIRLGQMEADARAARLSLQGEARDSRAVLALPALLRKNALVADARVLSQSTASPEASSESSREFPTRFALEIQFSLPGVR